MNDRCYLILGGAGMIGFQIAHRIARRLKPEKVILASLYQKDVRETISSLEREFPGIEFIGFWGDIFVRSEFNIEERQQRLNRNQLLDNSEYRICLFEDLFGDVDEAYRRSHLVQLILKHKPDIIIDSINTATAISYQDIYTATQIAHRDFNKLNENFNQKEVEIIEKELEDSKSSIEILMISQYIPQLIRHVILLNKAIREANTRLYLKVGTTGTGGMGLNIPYTHGEDKPSAKLMSKTAMAFAHTGLMFLMARTPTEAYPDAPPIIKEIKPAAMVGYSNITQKTVCRHGKPVYIFKSHKDALTDQLILQLEENILEKKEKLRIPIVETGENGIFTKGEFEAITALRQMEFMTPEEIARVVELEIRGVNTGKDVLAAIDGAIMGPTYRAGYLRNQAIEQIERLETQTKIPSVALGELGPPELSKLLWESYLLKQVYCTLKNVLFQQEENNPSQSLENNYERTPEEISISLENYLDKNPEISEFITSVGIPVLLSDGVTLLRGQFIRIPELHGRKSIKITEGDIDRWANKGWVDLRKENSLIWQNRFEKMLRGRQSMRGRGSDAINRATYLYKDIRIGEIVSWIFNNEIGGYRLM